MKKGRSMATIKMDPKNHTTLQIPKQTQHHNRFITEEIPGLIKLYQDGHVERPHIMPSVPPSLPPDVAVTCRDVEIDTCANLWARVYVPNMSSENSNHRLPLLVYFHGGGFCVGSPSWSCYHDFIGELASRAECVVVSASYRLAPENPLPAAYDDGVKTVDWVARQVFVKSSQWWVSKCDFKKMFLCGDSAGANIAYNVGLRLMKPLDNNVVIKGLVLIQPFFGGERRTYSETHAVGPALTLAAADAYWRMALPDGADRDHPWCNPTVGAKGGVEVVRGLRVMVCVSELDVLRDRNMEFCGFLGGDRRVERVVFRDVGHAFQVLNKTDLGRVRVREMICCIKNFVSR